MNIGPMPQGTGWLALDDDELLFRIESLPLAHPHDDELVEVVRSERHFFIRQEAAKRICDGQRLKAFACDRHIGQILVRQMQREEDIEYLEALLRDSRHFEVKNAARVQVARIRARLGLTGSAAGGRATRSDNSGSGATGAGSSVSGRKRRDDD